MGISSEQISGFFTQILQKGDPRAAMAAGKGPVTAAWAKAHGFTQYRSPGMPTSLGVLGTMKEASTLYGVYAQRKAVKKRTGDVKKETRKKKTQMEMQHKKRRLLRRPSRERGIL